MEAAIHGVPEFSVTETFIDPDIDLVTRKRVPFMIFDRAEAHPETAIELFSVRGSMVTRQYDVRPVRFCPLFVSYGTSLIIREGYIYICYSRSLSFDPFGLAAVELSRHEILSFFILEFEFLPPPLPPCLPWKKIRNQHMPFFRVKN